jgi:excisionase family DNA binding protein
MRRQLKGCIKGKGTTMSAEFLTKEDLARRLGVRPGTIREWVRRGRIPEIRFSPKVRRFDLEKVVAALSGRRELAD